jgi:hypothetical protein
MALDHGLPALIPRAVIAELSTSLGHAHLASPSEQPEPVVEKTVILDHGGPSLLV